MKLSLLGKKVGMTQVYDKTGIALPVTIVQLGENIVTAKLSKENNGYDAIQVGGFKTTEKRLTKPEFGVMKKNALPALKPLKEFRVDNPDQYTVGDAIKPESVLKEEMLVDVRGSSIGKGMQGTIKRWNAGRGPMAHGSKFHRSMGSIAPGTTPGRVFRGTHMPGKMGNKNVCQRHLKVVKVDSEKGLLYVKGAVPGVEGGLLVITPSKTKWN